MTTRLFLSKPDISESRYVPFTARRSDEANTIIRLQPGYMPSPLISLPLELQRGVASLHYKDEGNRFGLGSFKALGGLHGVYRAIEHYRSTGSHETLSSLTVACATDGNYGRAVSWAARLYGCQSRVYVNNSISNNREQSIRDLGATVIKVTGIYEEALRLAAEDAKTNNWTIVSDTGYDGCNGSPSDVMAGYATVMQEINQQWHFLDPPSHLFLQVGTGGFAASIITECLRIWPDDPPIFVVVEPVEADCAFQSAIAGESAPASGTLSTICAGLACSKLSSEAWPVLRQNVYAYMLIDDLDVKYGMRALAKLPENPIIAGETGCASFAAFFKAASQMQTRRALKLDSASRVIVFGTEGATDPDIYSAIIGGF